jgi:C4-dicarboxylate transporter
MKALISILNSDLSIPYLLLLIVILMIVYIVFKVSEFFWNRHQDNTDTMKQLSKNLEANTATLKNLNSKIPKLHTDLNRLFSAVKIITGDDWPKIREEIMKEHEFKEI